MKPIAIVTGATGGLGKAFVEELLKEDLDEIWAVARNPQKLGELCDAFGKKVIPVPCDLAFEAEVRGLAALLEERQPDVRFLINNAGVAKMGRIEAFSEDELSKTIEINCKTPTLLCRYALPYMSRGARILNIASASAFQPNPISPSIQPPRSISGPFREASTMSLGKGASPAPPSAPGGSIPPCFARKRAENPFVFRPWSPRSGRR